MKYIATYKGRPLNSIHSNGNGTIKDILPFSWKCFSIFKSPKQATAYLDYHKKYINSRTNDINPKLLVELNKIFDKIQIIPYP